LGGDGEANTTVHDTTETFTRDFPREDGTPGTLRSETSLRQRLQISVSSGSPVGDPEPDQFWGSTTAQRRDD